MTKSLIKIMKRIIISLCIIAATAGLALGATSAFFNDKELSSSNKFTAGTIDISVDGQNPWVESFSLENVLPGESASSTVTITNVGENSALIWKRIKNIESLENGVIEPEEEWYELYNQGEEKNDLERVVEYEMWVDGQKIVPSSTEVVLIGGIEDDYIYLAELEPWASMQVEQDYYLPIGTDNWAQSDILKFEIEYLALQTDAPNPNNLGFADDGWIINETGTQMIRIDEIGATSGQYGYDYDYSGANVDFVYNSPDSTLRGTLTASGLKPYATYQVKFEGKPVCQNNSAGDDEANEYIGYKGR